MGRLNFLFEKADIKQIAIIRIMIGVWFFVECVGMMLIGWMQEAYIHSKMNFPFYGFEWIHRLPPAGMYALYATLSLAALGIAFGYRYRLSLGVFFAGFLYVFMLDIVYSLNKFYLFLILTFLMMFIDAHRYWSLDAKRKPRIKRNYIPRWNILIFQVFIGMIYFYSGIAKLNVDWIYHSEPLRTFFGRKPYFTRWGPEVFDVIVYSFSMGGLVFDLLIAYLLAFRKTRFFANVVQGSFHTLNFFLLSIGTLSIFTGLATWLFFPTKWLIRKLDIKKFPKEAFPYTLKSKRIIAVGLSIFLTVHLLIPHRHYFTGNNVNWTEKGHRFSWRLMTRTKSGSRSMFHVKDPKTGEHWTVNPMDHLSWRQYRKMSAETDLVLVFSYYLEELWKEKGFDDVVVTAEIKTKLNGRTPNFLVDPNLDLTKCERTLLIDDFSTELKPRE
ncbi:MAG: HTTM domain-containing protein [Bacteroidota bacterium]